MEDEIKEDEPPHDGQKEHRYERETVQGGEEEEQRPRHLLTNMTNGS